MTDQQLREDDIDFTAHSNVVPIATTNGATPLEQPARPWLIDAADLLAQPDPGPTPWLIQDLIIDQAIAAFVGRWKTTKSYGLLHLCISIATGEPAFGQLEIPTPGPVVFVNEESGRQAMWRRLDALCRGRAIDPDRLRGQLHIAANARIKLDDKGWQQELIALGQHLQPRLFAFDPLARMKAPGREENAQSGMAEPIEYLRELRESTKAAVGFVHHTGHAGDTMRGSSDLESVWETRLAWKRDGQSPLVELQAEHREAETSDPIRYRINWDTETRSMRFDLVQPDGNALPPLEERIVAWLTNNPKSKARDIAKGLEVRASDVDRTLAELAATGAIDKGRSGRRDKLNRELRDVVYSALSTTDSGRCGSAQSLDFDTPGTSHGTSHDGSAQPRTSHPTNRPQTRTTEPNVAAPDNGTNQDEPHPGNRGSVPRPPSIGGDGPDEPPDNPPPYDDDDIPF